MKFKEFKNAVEDWGRLYNYKPTFNVDSTHIEITFEGEYYTNTICTIHKSERCVMDLDWKLYRNLSENAKGHLLDLVTEFARTPIEDRKDEKRFIIPLPRLATPDGKQQYLTHADGTFFALRRSAHLRQTWKEEHLKFVPEVYRQFAVELDEEEE